MNRHVPRPVTASCALYRLLISAYPRPFRDAFGSEMARTFEECCDEAYGRRGVVGLADVWGHAVVDIVATVVQEYALPARMHAHLAMASAGHVPAVGGDEDTFACPFCSEETTPGHRRCVYCGTDLRLYVPQLRTRPGLRLSTRKAPGYAAAQIMGEAARFYDWAYGEPRPHE